MKRLTPEATGNIGQVSAIQDLRHSLRTHINHVLGYTEMLLEEAAAQNRQNLLGELHSIQRRAKSLLVRTNEAVSSQRDGGVSQNELEELCDDLRSPVEQISNFVATLKTRAEAEGAQEFLPDLDKIATAAQGLIDHIEALTKTPGSGGAAVHSQSPTPQAAAAAPGGGSKRSRILVVDDIEANRDVLSRRIQRQDYDIAQASNGAQAVEMLRNGGYDLVLLDIMMPVMDGYEVLRRIKADPVMRDIPVIVVSALDEMESLVRCIEMGAEDYLLKPFDPVLLHARVRSSIEKKRLRNQERKHGEEMARALFRLKQTQDQLVMQEKLASLGSLTAGLAHEIKNPLNFVTNFASLSVELTQNLREKLEKWGTTLPEAERADFIEIIGDLEQNLSKIQEHGSRADSIIRGMLLHSRGGKGERRPTDINNLIREFVNLAYHGVRAHHIGFNSAVEFELDPAIGVIDAVPQDLSRVFLNLATNAFYALREKSERAGPDFKPVLRARTRDCGEMIEVQVRDNGTGISKEDRDKIFDPFFTTKPPGEGTGLGLSLSYEIVVQEHSGAMRVESEPGEFTEFIIRLPKEHVAA